MIRSAHLGGSVEIRRALLWKTDAQVGVKQRSPFNLPETARRSFLSRVRGENDRLGNRKGNSCLRWFCSRWAWNTAHPRPGKGASWPRSPPSRSSTRRAAARPRRSEAQRSRGLPGAISGHGGEMEADRSGDSQAARGSARLRLRKGICWIPWSWRPPTP